MITEINNKILPGKDKVEIWGATLTHITGHKWEEGRMVFEAAWTTGETSWEDLKDLKEDQTRMTTIYIITHDC